jgi:hypothetical protein
MNDKWEQPFCEDKCIRLLERTFSEASAKICLTRDSYLSIDDDQYHLQSKKSEEMGFVRVNNPKKAFGPVSTNVVSLGSGLIIGMRLLGRGENYQTVVKILLRWIHFQDCDEQVKGQNTICLDRGYMKESLITHFMNCGFKIIGTHKQEMSFPFSFGKTRGMYIDLNKACIYFKNVTLVKPGQKYIEEKGAKSLYFAKRKIGNRDLYALA